MNVQALSHRVSILWLLANQRTGNFGWSALSKINSIQTFAKLSLPVPWFPFENFKWHFAINVEWSLKSMSLNNVVQMSFFSQAIFSSCVNFVKTLAHQHTPGISRLQSGGCLLKNTQYGPLFLLFMIQEKTMAKSFQALWLWLYTRAINSYNHCPSAHVA